MCMFNMWLFKHYKIYMLSHSNLPNSHPTIAQVAVLRSAANKTICPFSRVICWSDFNFFVHSLLNKNYQAPGTRQIWGYHCERDKFELGRAEPDQEAGSDLFLTFHGSCFLQVSHSMSLPRSPPCSLLKTLRLLSSDPFLCFIS